MRRIEETPVMPGLPGLPGENEVYAQNHSLFIDEKPVVMNPLRDEDGKIVDGFYEQDGGFTVYKLFLGNFEESGNGIQRIINKLQSAKDGDILEFHISSNGGSVDELLELYNLCDTLFFGRVTTYANHAYSAGAWAFLMGTDRVLYEHSSLMWHSYAGGFGGKRQDLLDHMKHEDSRLNVFLMGTLEPYFTAKEIKKMNSGKDFWLNTEDACKRGIATHVMIHGEVISADDYLQSIDPVVIKAKAKEAKKLEKKLQKEVDKLAKIAKKVTKKETKKTTKNSNEED